MKKNVFNNENIGNKINDFSKMSNDQLMKELVKQAKLEKGKGNLSNEKLENFYKVASSFMQEEEKEKLKKLLDIVKSS